MDKNMEKYLMKIQSVLGCKVVQNENEEIDEIHIVSDLRRNPKQILRDVEAVLLTEFNQKIDYKKISIAQVQSDTVKYDGDPRLKLKLVEYNNSGRNITVSVELEKNDNVYKSQKTGIATANNIKRICSESVLEAVEKFCGIDDIFVFEDAKRIDLANVGVMVVCISSVLNGREELLTGTAAVKNDSREAIVRATLDAINRHVLHITAVQ